MDFCWDRPAPQSLIATRTSLAQDTYPSRAITIINPFPPGGATDVVTRPFAAALEPIVKQPVVIDTKAGAAGAVGAQVAAAAKPDGYTLLSHLPSLVGLCRSRPSVRTPAEIHQCRFHSDRAPDRRSLRADRQRPATLQDAEGFRRRRQQAAERNPVLVVGTLRRAAYSDGAVYPRRQSQAAPSADTRRRPGVDRADRQQCAGAGVVGVGVPRAGQGRQGAPARAVRPASARRRCPTCRP